MTNEELRALSGETIPALIFGTQDLINAVEDVYADELSENERENLVVRMRGELDCEDRAEEIGKLVREFLRNLARELQES